MGDVRWYEIRGGSKTNSDRELETSSLILFEHDVDVSNIGRGLNNIILSLILQKCRDGQM